MFDYQSVFQNRPEDGINLQLSIWTTHHLGASSKPHQSRGTGKASPLMLKNKKHMASLFKKKHLESSSMKYATMKYHEISLIFSSKPSASAHGYPNRGSLLSLLPALIVTVTTATAARAAMAAVINDHDRSLSATAMDGAMDSGALRMASRVLSGKKRVSHCEFYSTLHWKNGSQYWAISKWNDQRPCLGFQYNI